MTRPDDHDDTSAAPSVVIDREGLDALLLALRTDGYETVGPTVRDGAIVYDRVEGVADLPSGWGDEQEAGRYRLRERDDEALFGYAVGPHSWKQFLFPPRVPLWSATRDAEGELQFGGDAEPAPRYAFIGVRGCELAAIAIQDRVFLGGEYVDADYAQRREQAFIVALNCGEAGGTCFCVSMGTGPEVERGFDLALTELLDGEQRFLVEAGSERGAELLARLPSRAAAADDEAEKVAVLGRTRASMGRELETDGIKELLYAAVESPRWDEIATRCLSCTNCTLVCPTCYCHSVRDTSDLAMVEAEAVREWDSCFGLEHSYAARSSVRASTAVALPPVADAQACELGGPVRLLGLRRLRALRDVVPSRDRHHRRGRSVPHRCRRSRREQRVMDVAATVDDLVEHRFFHGLRREHLEALVDCAHVRDYGQGAFLFRQGDHAADFFLLRNGSVAIEVAAPPRGTLSLQTVHADEVMGWAWIVEPFVHRFDARATEPTQVIELNGDCLRGKLDADHEFAYQLLRRFVGVVADRLEAARLQLLDVYGDEHRGS